MRWPRWARRWATTRRRSSRSTSCTAAASTRRASRSPAPRPYPLIGHGIDFAWSGTSANGDNQDTFVERLCNPDGSAPSQKSTHYTYKGQCIAFNMRDQTLTTPFSPLSPTDPPTTITYRTMRSVHGPVFAYATVGGTPVALAKAKGVDFHELDAPFRSCAWPRTSPEARASSCRSWAPSPAPRTGSTSIATTWRSSSRACSPGTRAAATWTGPSWATAAPTGRASTRARTPSRPFRRRTARRRSTRRPTAA